MPGMRCPYCDETISEEDLDGIEEEVFHCPFCEELISRDDI